MMPILMLEACDSIKSVKYIYKYVYKGHDSANIELSSDELKNYLDLRYVCAPEAAYRLFEYKMRASSHCVYNLSTSSWIMKKRMYNVLSPHLQNSPHGSFSTHPVNMPDSTCTQTFPFIFLSPITNGKNVEGHKKSLLALLTFFHLT